MIWSGIGINYGHQVADSVYDTAQVNSDLDYLYSLGFRKIRIAYPTFGASQTLTNCQDMVTRALAKGFYVQWGVVSNSPSTATIWGNFKTYVSGTLAPYAQSLNNANFELAIGNEEELHCDGTTLTASTVRSDIKTLATTCQGIYTIGNISYQADAGQISAWNSLGIGNLDLIGFNVYGPISSFSTDIKNIIGNFGIQGFISEFDFITNGFADYASEMAWYSDVISRMQAIRKLNLTSAYAFTYRDGQFGSTPNTWALKLNTEAWRLAFLGLLGGRILVT